MQNSTERKQKVVNRATPYLFLVLVVLEFLDLHSTWLGIHERGEANPLVNAVIESTGSVLSGLVLSKCMAIGLIVLMFRAWAKAPPAYAPRTTAFFLLLVMNALLGFAVFNNYLI